MFTSGDCRRGYKDMRVATFLWPTRSFLVLGPCLKAQGTWGAECINSVLESCPPSRKEKGVSNQAARCGRTGQLSAI